MKFFSLNLFRFFAAIIVLFYHNMNGSVFLEEAPNILTAGPQMVTFFFVLSGFVSMLSYSDNRTFLFKQYYIKKAFRILPYYLLALSLSVVAHKLRGWYVSPVDFLLNLFCLQSWIPGYSLTINGPGWFVSDLMFFYFLFPIILYLFRLYIPKPGAVLLISFLIWLFTQIVITYLLNTSFYKGYPSPSHDLIYYFTLSHFCSFFMGASGAYFLFKRKEPIDLKLYPSVFLILFSFLSILFLIENESSINNRLGINLPFASSFYAPLFLSLILSFSISKNFSFPCLFEKFSSFLSELSYPIYILQIPVFIILNPLLKKLSGNQDIFLVYYILLLFIFCIFSLFIFERPFKKFFLNKIYIKSVSQTV